MTTTESTSVEYTFTVAETGVDVDWRGQTLTIEASDLRDGGWEFKPECGRDHCSDGDCPSCLVCDDRGPSDDADLGRAVEQWHNETHESVLRFCDHPVCVAMGRVMGVRHG